MAKATVSRVFDATDTTKGVSVRVQPGEKPQTLPVWVIEAGEAVGAAVRRDRDAQNDLAVFAHALRERGIGRRRVAQVIAIAARLADRFACPGGGGRLAFGRFGDRGCGCRDGAGGCFE